MQTEGSQQETAQGRCDEATTAVRRRRHKWPESGESGTDGRRARPARSKQLGSRGGGHAAQGEDRASAETNHHQGRPVTGQGQTSAWDLLTSGSHGDACREIRLTT